MDGINERHSPKYKPSPLKHNDPFPQNHKAQKNAKYLGYADYEISESRVNPGLVLEPSGDGFAQSF